MGNKVESKKKNDEKHAFKAEEWAEKVVAEAQEMDAIENGIAQILTQIEDILQIQAGENGIDATIHKIDKHMGKALFREELREEVYA